MSTTPRTDAAKIIRARINGPPNSGADSGAEGFEEVVTVEFAKSLETALRFYADENNWLDNHPFGSPVSQDKGDTARNALEGVVDNRRMIDSPARCIKCGARYTSPTTGKVMNACVCGGELFTHETE